MPGVTIRNTFYTKVRKESCMVSANDRTYTLFAILCWSAVYLQLAFGTRLAYIDTVLASFLVGLNLRQICANDK